VLYKLTNTTQYRGIYKIPKTNYGMLYYQKQIMEYYTMRQRQL